MQLTQITRRGRTKRRTMLSLLEQDAEQTALCQGLSCELAAAKQELTRIQAALAVDLCPYKVGDVLTRRLRYTDTVVRCQVIGIKHSRTEWKYLLETKKIRANGTLCATIVKVLKDSDWRLE